VRHRRPRCSLERLFYVSTNQIAPHRTSLVIRLLWSRAVARGKIATFEPYSLSSLQSALLGPRTRGKAAPELNPVHGFSAGHFTDFLHRVRILMADLPNMISQRKLIGRRADSGGRTTPNRGSECKRLWVLKKSVIGAVLGAEQVCWEFSFLTLLGVNSVSRRYRLAEEAHQSLDVLRRRCQEELFPRKP
jgi:hypothetical protein